MTGRRDPARDMEAARAIARVRGDDYRSKLLHALADGAYSRAITDARTPFDWLSRDPAVADAFMADETCGFMFGAGAYATLTELAHRANDPATYRDTPHDLPLLFVSGDADPVGKCGRAVADEQQILGTEIDRTEHIAQVAALLRRDFIDKNFSSSARGERNLQ